MKKITFLLFILLLAINAYSAILKNVPIELKQPDGVIIHCFITGDEFHRRVHDKDNYTIIQNPQTGYYVYAILSGDKLLPTDYIVGRFDPKTLSINPGLDIPASVIEKQTETRFKSAKAILENSTKGNLNNIVISIRFSDQSPTTLTKQDYENKFNSTSGVSLKSYFKEVSNSQLNISSYYYPSPQNQTILEYQDSHPRAYYSEFNVVTNPIGYKNDTEEWERESSITKNAIQSCENQIVQSNINFDSNSDGYIDNFVFVIQGDVDGWSSLLWPHASSYSGNISVGSKISQRYNFQFSASLSASVLSHEFFHSIGAPDLYRYTNQEIDPVGAWDLMSMNTNQHMTTAMKWKYGKWFDNIPEITQPGTYTLNPVSQSQYACYKIKSPNSPSEYFMLEYRKKEGSMESTLPYTYKEGLIIYRINTQVAWGNAQGPPDELYIYRVNGTDTTDGDLTKAAFSANFNRTSFNNETNPSCFLSNGDRGWISISNVSTAGSQISFTVNAVTLANKPRNFNAIEQNNQILLQWNSPSKNGQTLLGYNVYIKGNNSPLNTNLISDTSYITRIPGQEIAYTFKLIAKYQQDNSDPTTCVFRNKNNPEIIDSLALVALYNKCDGQNWTKKRNWLTGPISTWEGVTILNGRVDRLDLYDYNNSVGLVGEIPSELFNLTMLRYLDLSYNKLTGSLPENWSTLVKLNYLYLSDNLLTGSLPINWSSLVNLQGLDLSNNQLSGSLPSSWSSFVNIYYLALSGNQFTDSLPESWSSLLNLQYFYLSGNQLTGFLPSSWSSLVKLRYLSLFSNKLTGTLPSSWSSLVNLQLLDLSVNQLSGSLPESWKSLVNLQYFYLNSNLFTGTLPESWSSLVNLQYFYLNSNLFTGTLPASWSSLVKLQYLILYTNKFTGSLPSSWSSLIQLLNLNLYNNQISGILPSSWSSLVQLKNLSLGSNQFTGSLPSSWSSLVNLQYLYLYNNQIQSLPDLVHLTNLNLIYISNNMLDFGDIEPNINVPKVSFIYDQQANIGKSDTIIKKQGEEFKISIITDGKNNKYQWYKNGGFLTGANGSEYLKPIVNNGDAGIYTCQITNTVATQLTLTSNPITLKVISNLIANAGQDQTVNEGEIVTLDGSASLVPTGKSISYKWTPPPGITLSSNTSAKPTFTAPNVDFNTNHTFSLVVNDGTEDSPVDQVVITVKNITDYKLRTTVFLEGAYNSGSGLMNTSLRTSSLIPLSQPYNVSPLNYAGTEHVVSIPTDVVDWVLVELRQASVPSNAIPGTILSGWPKACFLKSNGAIVDLDGTSPISIGNPTVTGNLYIVIRHRTHLAIMSASGAVLNGETYSFDFSTGVLQAHGGSSGYRMVGSGANAKAVMVTGDMDRDGNILVSDYNSWAVGFGSNSRYVNSDIDMDGNAMVSDYNKWAANFGSSSGNTLKSSKFKTKYSCNVPE